MAGRMRERATGYRDAAAVVRWAGINAAGQAQWWPNGRGSPP
jgi:hypothetical protein